LNKGHAVNNQLARRNKVKRLLRNVWKYRVIYLMISVGVLYFIIFKYATFYGLLLAFKNYKIRLGIMGSPWVGLKNFSTVFSGKDFPRVFQNTIIISFFKLLFGFPAPIIISLLLNELTARRFKRVAQTALYFPHFISWTILAGMFYSLFSATMGVIPRLLASYGISMPSMIYDPNYIRGFLYATDVWKNVGWYTIIYLAAISGIDPQLYDAAIVDGCNRFQQVRYVTLPSIMLTIVTLLVLNVGGIMNAGFEQIFNLESEITRDVVDIIDTYVYRFGLRSGKFEYATVVGITKSIINCALLFTANWVAGKLAESPF